jgi:hypothetical protein
VGSSASNNVSIKGTVNNNASNCYALGATVSAGASGIIALGHNIGSTPISNTVYFNPGIVNVTGGTATVYNTSTGQFGPSTSSQRFKTNIVNSTIDYNQLLNLQARQFEWNTPGAVGLADFGLIAEEVDTYLPELVVSDSVGPYSVRYDHISVLLIEKIKELETRLAALESLP